MKNGYEHLDVTELSSVMEQFLQDIRKIDGKFYKATSLDSLRHSLNRQLRSPPFYRRIDIVKFKAGFS
ncbi:hypothetical protein DPMN_029921 [Dreissena polymorpha]|uniref:Uncharacterized protein n=1 Tax=Dreissena polymorpha TaxID=45954 RepID=A0A9D4LY38_DREPO|nr:hypothetical protein DPMN_029921 [Dreissena polymorpha]